MANMMWQYVGKADLACEQRGLRLVVDKSPVGTGYRYRVRSTKADAAGNLASGYREELRDALDAGERVLRSLAA